MSKKRDRLGDGSTQAKEPKGPQADMAEAGTPIGEVEAAVAVVAGETVDIAVEPTRFDQHLDLIKQYEDIRLKIATLTATAEQLAHQEAARIDAICRERMDVVDTIRGLGEKLNDVRGRLAALKPQPAGAA